MSILNPFNFKKWIDDNRHLLKPPVGNQQVYLGNEHLIVMVVGGPNSRKDYHYNEGEEFFFQIEGDIILKIIEDNNKREIHIKEGDIFLLPSKIPHCPQRPANTVGLVLETYRNKGEKDGFLWFCEKCDHSLYKEFIEVNDIVKQLPIVMEKFYSNLTLRTCKNCGTIMEPPLKL